MTLRSDERRRRSYDDDLVDAANNSLALTHAIKELIARWRDRDTLYLSDGGFDYSYNREWEQAANELEAILNGK